MKPWQVQKSETFLLLESIRGLLDLTLNAPALYSAELMERVQSVTKKNAVVVRSSGSTVLTLVKKKIIHL